ncbi:DUF461 domain-containing protein [Streptomyces sp. 6N223]|uniref:DUF461 domain-containing protein n=1 Tax=Streptomyces sp. 6N223 TaxID=3457412 RepID=UPI003FD4817E
MSSSLSSSLRRGVTAAAVITLPLAALAACGTGNDAETNEVRPDNASTQVEDIKVQNVNVILPAEGERPAGITARLFNNGSADQTLQAIRLPGTGDTVELAPAGGEAGGGGIVIPAGGDVALGGEGNPSAVIASPAGIRLGDAQRVVFDMSETGGISLDARVVNDSGQFDHYAEWGPTPEPTSPTATPDETAGTEETGAEETAPEETAEEETAEESPAVEDEG